MTDRYVLVVDDHADVRLLISDILDTLGVPYQTAVNGEEALRMAQQNPPAVMVLDIMMPVMNGLSLLAQLNRHGKSSPIPVILLSAVADNSLMRDLPGVIAVLRKGDFNISGLQSLLMQALGESAEPRAAGSLTA